jgi:GDSL-like lipase/acylhydrolase family protein
VPRSFRRGEALLVLGSVSLFVLLAEGAVRLLGIDRPRPRGYAPVNTKRRGMRPVNSHGYRDLERAIPKPPGTRRVLSLGDSFAWGASVEFEDAYPQRLERGLTRRRHERWEVVNLALPGMNTVDEAAQLAGEGMAYQPDVVLLGYVLNDSEDSVSAERRRAADWVEARAAPKNGWLDHSALFRLVGARVSATVENRRRVTGYRSMYADDATGWIAARAALRSMGALCRQRGVPLVVAIFPLFANPLDQRYPFTEVHAKVAEAAEEAGAKVVDLRTAYRDLRWELLVVDGTEDEHPNEIAHRIAAYALLHALDDVVPWSAGAPRPDEESPEPGPS